MLGAVPGLRAFAISLCGSADRGDDLVQEALLRGIANIHQFTLGTNMAAWLTTILRNCFLNECRVRGRDAEDPNGILVATLTSQPTQEASLRFTELWAALLKLPIEQREAIILVAGEGRSYDDAAAICRCAVGTMKSRIHRARARLAELLSVESVDDFGPDGAIHAALCAENLRWAA